jgi:hypothetical protein
VYLFETDNKNIIVTKGENHIDVKTGLIYITRINQEPQEKDSGKNSRKQESCKNCKKKRIRQEVKKKRIRQELKKTRILPGEAFLALSDKILSTRISQELPDLFFQARILYRRNGKRILTDKQENQESGKTIGKIVD